MSQTRPSQCPGPQPLRPRSRREFLRAAGNGFGLLGLADLLGARDSGRLAGRTRWPRRPGTSPPRPSAASSCS